MTGQSPAQRRRKVIRAVVGIALVLAFIVCVRTLKQAGAFERALQWLASLGPWAPVMFVVLYVVAALLMIPASILTIGGGMLFGLVRGGTYVLTAALIAATLCFLIARHIARGWISHRLEAHPKFIALDQAVAREGWKIVAMVRFAPVFPFSITSYGFGLTRVPLWHYVLASFAMIPGTLWYVYLGTLVGDIAGIRQQAPMSPWLKVGIAVIAFTVIFYITRFVQRALRQRTG